MNKLLLAVAAFVVILHADSVLGHCKCGWTAYEGFCYHVSSRTRTWAQAQRYCRLRGGNLVKIVSPEENDFVLALSHKFARSKRQMWIGLRRWQRHRYIGYHWTDGAPARYRNWARGEPNFVHRREYCVHMYTDPKRTQLNALAGTWNDLQCGFQRNFYCGTICEKLA